MMCHEAIPLQDKAAVYMYLLHTIHCFPIMVLKSSSRKDKVTSQKEPSLSNKFTIQKLVLPPCIEKNKTCIIIYGPLWILKDRMHQINPSRGTTRGATRFPRLSKQIKKNHTKMINMTTRYLPPKHALHVSLQMHT